MTRQVFRQGLATFFGGSTYDPQGRTYSGGPLTTSGLGCVRAYLTKREPDSDFVLGQVSGRSMGAVMLIHLPEEGPEQRIGIGGAHAGIKWDPFQVQLHIYHVGMVDHAEDAQADLDQLLDAAKALIHGDRTLGGICTQAGESAQGRTRTQMRPPVVGGSPERTKTYALITFGADFYITA